MILILIVGIVAIIAALTVIPKRKPNQPATNSIAADWLGAKPIGPNAAAMDEKLSVVQIALRDKHEAKFRKQALAEIKELIDSDG